MVCSLGRLYVIYLLFLFVVNLDDCWQRSRDAQGIIQADPTDFPSGIPALADYIHSRKLKFGLYSGIFVYYNSMFIYDKQNVLFCCIHQMQEPKHVLVVLVHCTMKLKMLIHMLHGMSII
jgi:hypothetical protein